MGHFKPGGGSRFGGGNRGGGSRFGGGDRRDSRGGGNRFGGDREVTMHEAICAECKKTCEVPFRPTNERPVYCRDCFANRGGGSSDNRAPRGDFNSRPFSKPKFEGNRGGDQGGSDVKRQLESINTKLDKLLSVLGANTPVAKKPVQETVAKSEGLKEVVKTAVKSDAKVATSAKVKKTSAKKASKKK